TRNETPTDRAVHEARKRLREARAMTRLLRPALDEAEYQQVNKALRAASQPLSVVRDAKVLTDALQRAIKHGSGQRAPFRAVARALARRRLRIRQKVLGRQVAGKHIAAILADCEGPIQGWRFDGVPAESLQHGVKEVYRKARKAQRTAKR